MTIWIILITENSGKDSDPFNELLNNFNPLLISQKVDFILASLNKK